MEKISIAGTTEIFLTGKNTILERHQQLPPCDLAQIFAKLSGAEIARIEKSRLASRDFYTQKGWIYTDEREHKTMLLNVNCSEGRIDFDTTETFFFIYDAVTNNDSPAFTDAAMITGNCGMTITADKKVICQLRDDKKNASYAGFPGASVAGLMGTFTSADPNLEVRDFFEKRSMAEIGIFPEQHTLLYPLGLAKDLWKPHLEILMYAETSLTSSELSAGLGNNGISFAEKFFTFDFSAENVHKALVEARCPFPTTHVAALIAAAQNNGFALDYQAIETNYMSMRYDPRTKPNNQSLWSLDQFVKFMTVKM